MENTAQLPSELLSRLRTAAGKVRECSQVNIISHYDADGISSAGVLCSALLRENIQFQATLTKSLDDKMIDRVANSSHQCVIFSDMGSAHLTALENIAEQTIILDHHKPPGDSEELVHINPHLWGIDGMTAASASSLCMLFALEMSEDNWPLLPIAFAGIAGDRQHIRELEGINDYLFQNGKQKGLVSLRKGSLLPDGKLGQGLISRIEPYIVGVNGDKGGAEELLEKAGVPPDRTVDELNEEKRRKLSSLIALELLKQGCTARTFEEITRDHYYFPSLGRSASDMASLMNACGRLDQEGLGVALAMGDREAEKRAESLREQYIGSVLQALGNVEGELDSMEHIQYFHNEEPGLAGVVCGISMQYMADQSKPTLALSERPPNIKVSSRATFELLDMGIDLTEAMRDGADAVGGSGGGHSIASGATIPEDKEEEFLQSVNRIVGRQKETKNAR